MQNHRGMMVLRCHAWGWRPGPVIVSVFFQQKLHFKLFLSTQVYKWKLAIIKIILSAGDKPFGNNILSKG